MERSDFEKLKEILDRASVVQESPSWWQLSFAEKLFEEHRRRREDDLNKATVAQIRIAARRKWPMECLVNGCYSVWRAPECFVSVPPRTPLTLVDRQES